MGIFLGDADLRVIDGIGKSPADFATDAILLFLDEQISCSGDENAIFACLKRVVQNHILVARGAAAVKTTQRVERVPGKATGDGKVLKGLDDYPHGMLSTYKWRELNSRDAFMNSWNTKNPNCTNLSTPFLRKTL